MMLGINYRWSSIVVDERQVDSRSVSIDELKKHAYVGWDQRLNAGDRAPDAPGLVSSANHQGTSLFTMFHPAKHTVMIFPISPDTTRVVLEAIENVCPTGSSQILLLLSGDDKAGDYRQLNVDFMFVDRDGHAKKAYFKQSGDETFFIIRPDGFIGGLVETAEGARRYFTSIFR